MREPRILGELLATSVGPHADCPELRTAVTRTLTFDPLGWDDYTYWQCQDSKTLIRGLEDPDDKGVPWPPPR